MNRRSEGMNASELVEALRDKHKHSAEAYGCEEHMPMAKFWQSYADLSASAADLIEAQSNALEEMRECLPSFYDAILLLSMYGASVKEHVKAYEDMSAALASHSKEGEW